MTAIDKSKPGWWNTIKAAEKTHCKNNHALTPENIFSRPGRSGRYCIKCRDTANAYHVERNRKTRASRHTTAQTVEGL